MNLLRLPKIIFVHLTVSLGLFTRFPVTSHKHDISLGKTVWAWPVIGILIGLFTGICAEVLNSLVLPPEISALLILALLVVSTGGFHEDGLADTCDGLWGGRTPEKRLEIMKDSRIGVFGVLALILTLLMRWILLKILFESGFLISPLVVVCTTSRVAIVPFMKILPNARRSGLSSAIGNIPLWSVGICVLISLIPIFIFLGPIGFLPVVSGLLITIPIYYFAKKLLHGQTGDVLGTVQQLTEIGILMSIVLFYTG